MLLLSKTDIVVVSILRRLVWICHMIFSIYVISMMLNNSNCWIDFKAVCFDTVYPFFGFVPPFFLACWCYFVVASFCSFPIGAMSSLCDVILFLTRYFFVSSLHLHFISWLFQHWLLVLSTFWSCLYFFLLLVIFTSFLQLLHYL